MRITAISLLALLAAAGCGLLEVDRLDVSQGNRLEAREIEQLRVGMSPTEVRELLGTPVIASPFHPGRWDYVYYRTEAGHELDETPRRLTIRFEDGVVAGIEDRYPVAAEAEAADE